MVQELLLWAESRGYQVAWGPVEVLPLVRADLEKRRNAGEIEPDFAQENLSFDLERAFSDAAFRRVLVIAMPRPAHLVTFTVAGRQIDAVLPPTYERYQPTFEDVRKDLVAHAIPASNVEHLNVPLKLLASCLGLVRYGRNNLAYAPSIGSYMQLLGYLTDAELPIEPGWEPCEPCALDACRGCRVCQSLCPTGAITPDRFLLRAECCLTLANETARSWPPWVRPSAHRCLIGCLQCQRLCPANPGLAYAHSGVTFTAEETAVMLAGGDHRGPIWERVRMKLELLGQPYHENVIGRNLHALLRVREASGEMLE